MGASISCAWKRTIKGDKLIGDSCQRIVEVCVLLKYMLMSNYLNFNCWRFFVVLFSAAHVRTGSTGSLSNSQLTSPGQNDVSLLASSSQEEMRCYLEHQHQGHQQLVTCMDVVGNTVLTGSQDHTLKVSLSSLSSSIDRPIKFQCEFANIFLRRCSDWIWRIWCSHCTVTTDQ